MFNKSTQFPKHQRKFFLSSFLLVNSTTRSLILLFLQDFFRYFFIGFKIKVPKKNEKSNKTIKIANIFFITGFSAFSLQVKVFFFQKKLIIYTLDGNGWKMGLDLLVT